MPRYMVIGRSHDYRNPGTSPDYDEISISAMKKTGQFIEEYEYRFLAYPKAKNDFTTEQFVLWEKETTPSDEKMKELYRLIEGFSKDDYTCRRNSISMQSIPGSVHYHIAKFRDLDKEISGLFVKLSTDVR